MLRFVLTPAQIVAKPASVAVGFEFTVTIISERALSHVPNDCETQFYL